MNQFYKDYAQEFIDLELHVQKIICDFLWKNVPNISEHFISNLLCIDVNNLDKKLLNDKN